MVDYVAFKTELTSSINNMFAEADVVMADTDLHENVRLARLIDIGTKYGVDLSDVA